MADDAGYQDLAVRQLDLAPHLPFVLVPHIAGLYRVGAGPDLEQQVDDGGERQIGAVRPVPAAPADMIADPVLRQAAQRVMESGARGVKVILSGRLGGAEQARTEKVLEGRVPLHTLRADIDYGTALARTTYGILGIKVLVFNGEVIGGKTETFARPQRRDRDERRPEGGDRPARRRPTARRRTGGE